MYESCKIYLKYGERENITQEKKCFTHIQQYVISICGNYLVPMRERNVMKGYYLIVSDLIGQKRFYVEKTSVSTVFFFKRKDYFIFKVNSFFVKSLGDSDLQHLPVICFTKNKYVLLNILILQCGIKDLYWFPTAACWSHGEQKAAPKCGYTGPHSWGVTIWAACVRCGTSCF